MLNKNSQVEGDDPPACDSPQKSFAGFKIHILSMIHEALMPFDPCTTLRTKKNTINQAPIKEYQCRRQNTLEIGD